MATFSLDDLNLEPHERTQPVCEPPTLLTDFPELIDNTAREQFFNCPRKFQLSSINQLAPVRKSIHLHAGGAYAAGLEALRKAFYSEGKTAEDALAIGVEALIKFYGEYEPLDTDLKTCERMVGALVSYTQQYPLESDALKPLEYAPGRHAVEFTFAIPLPVLHPVTNLPILYAGRFDMLAVFHDSLFVEDDKTTSQLGPTWGKQWELNSQFTGYIWAAQTYGFNAVGAIIRGQSILKHEYGHAQAITYRPQWMIDRWYEQLCRDVWAMVEAWKAGYFNFALGSACSAYGGCEFRMLCTSQHPNNWLEGNYCRRHWNPTQKDPEAPSAKENT